MRKTFVVIPALMLALVAASPASAQDKEGERIADNVCANCHGRDGNSTSPLFPRLAGQQAEYLDTQLKAFRDRSRSDPHARAFMWGMTQTLNDAAIASLAGYYAKQKAVPLRPATTSLAQAGKRIYEQGIDAQGIPACAGCHGDNAEGKEAIPRLAGQHTLYLTGQLDAFRSLLRDNPLMHETTKNLDNDQISAVAAYLGGD